MMSGFLGWLVWVLIYIQFLAEGSVRLSVFSQWGLDVPKCKVRSS